MLDDVAGPPDEDAQRAFRGYCRRPFLYKIRGVAIITVDEDEQPEKADTCLATHRKSNWSNYHDDDEINHLLPGDGLPQFVLIDATGKIVYAKSGFDEHGLRSALSRFSPGYMSLASKAK